MGPCNSHKCHCPRCMAARSKDDQVRRDAWKRLARQHHIDQAGVCLAPREFCTCPNCIEVREFYALRPGERIARVHTSVTEFGKTRWIWAHYAGRLGKGWCRKDIDTQKFFGAASIKNERIVYSTSPNSADNWVRSMFTDPPAYVSAEEATALYREWYDLNSPWADPPSKTTIGAVSGLLTPEARLAFLHGDWTKGPVMKPLPLAILTFYSAVPNTVFHRSGSVSPLAISEAHELLLQFEMLETTPCCPGYRLTERAKVLLTAISELPLPVRKAAPWTMPA